MSNQPPVQTISEVSNVVNSFFTNLANMIGLSQLKESFFQNIIYILIVIIILIGILVYIQMVGTTGNNPLNSPPTREIKKVEIQKIVEGFDTDTEFGANGIEKGAFGLDNNNNIDLTYMDEIMDIHSGAGKQKRK